VEKSFLFDAQRTVEEIKPEIIMLDGFYPEVAIELSKVARKKGIPVVLDGGSWKPATEKLLRLVDVAICSSDFFPPGCVNTDEVFNFLKGKGVKKMAVTRGGDSIVYCETARGEIDLEPVNCIDTLGAGDFLHGAFCYYYLQNNDFINSLCKASKIASFSCRFRGTRDWLKMVD
jgi:sugar/nucleoside kinase (ribokinase family)